MCFTSLVCWWHHDLFLGWSSVVEPSSVVFCFASRQSFWINLGVGVRWILIPSGTESYPFDMSVNQPRWGETSPVNRYDIIPHIQYFQYSQTRRQDGKGTTFLKVVDWLSLEHLIKPPHQFYIFAHHSSFDGQKTGEASVGFCVGWHWGGVQIPFSRLVSGVQTY